ncbi:ATP-dependent nuclease [Leeuwenhoekiella marinoflava]|uniref:Predicted ATP-dependent endonuclease of the OLD family, contains P-loop ATPase and TOPRIM domains n=2 Tax=Leeuwenhoekiella marinoflava TaxID=988 RepID=A0ABY1HR75_9FLAO|nr:AAA family ATPase [Leeuwenhoekiella marinoflava]RXG30693.1 putative ATP-dependent endonuclease of OLD family [Leeuwenhoekiella marinoflava]SHF19442.1 Predicted ATP-dependent endonuclease of the OLD family, contains P-loop ATPase and TOPRIM domains [Leeuwenhoekiella marinoflava DSM 3653]
MYISKIAITNYRGIKEQRIIHLEQLSSIVGKNDAGKTIVLFSVATFLDIRSFPITFSDFNDIDQSIVLEFDFKDENISELLMSKLKSKVKKADGLDEYIKSFIFDGAIKYKREAVKVDKKFSSEYVLMEDFEQEDLRGLYLKTDEELNALLETYGIEIPVKGKGRNSKIEKIKYIRERFSEAERASFWIEDDAKISSLFPAVEMFKADYGLEADTKFKTNSVSEIQDYFDKEAGEENTKLKKVESEIIEEMKKEAESVKIYMKDYASALRAVQIIPVVNWKDAIKGVDVSFQFDGDEKFIPMSHKGTGYRRLFMVARFRYLAEKSKGNNIIYLIEEPETFLHPTAQLDLLNAFKDLSNDNQIIITTHSPVFAGATSVNGVVLCKKDIQSNYSNASKENDTEFLMSIVEELGIKPSYNLRDHHEKIVFVESSNDAKFYHLLCDKLIGSKLLQNNKILVLPFGGGEDIESFLNIDYFDSSNRGLYLIIDSDKKENKQDKQNQRAEIFRAKSNGNAYVISKSCIENYYHPRAFERVYELEENTFDFFTEDENVRITIKHIIEEKTLKNKNIKEKNNFRIFNETTKVEFEEIVEQELIDFLKEITY